MPFVELNLATEATELSQPAAAEWLPPHLHTRLAAGRLRRLADWLEAYEIEDSEICAVSTDGLGDLHVNLTDRGFYRLCRSHQFRPSHGGHFHCIIEGVDVFWVPPTTKEQRP